MSYDHAQNIAEYLNPNYWGGHTLGHGEALDTFEMSLPRSANRFAKRAIHSRVRGTSVFPQHTFRTGEVFDPSAYRPGTVVLFREDVLHGQSVLPEYSLDELAAQEVPPRPTETVPSFGMATPFIGANDGKRQFMSRVYWGVVPRESDDSFLTAVPALGVAAREAGALAILPFTAKSAPITVGETMHKEHTRFASGRLRRVNILHIVAYGIPEQQRRRVFGFAARTALGGTN